MDNYKRLQNISKTPVSSHLETEATAIDWLERGKIENEKRYSKVQNLFVRVTFIYFWPVVKVIES